MPKPQLVKRVLFTNCCNLRTIWIAEAFVKDSAGWCSKCNKLLFIEDNGHVYLVGEKVF